MTNFSFSGLSSGLDTTSLITKLMTVAAQPQTQLKTVLAATQSTSAAYGKVTDSLSTLATALASLGATSSTVIPTGASAVWSAMTVRSSSTAVAASATDAATAGSSMTFDVVALAKAQTSTVALDNGVAVANTDAGLDITRADGTTVHVELVDGSGQAVADAVNAADAGVRAQVVQTDQGAVLRFSATTTGVAAGFTVAGLDHTPTTVTAASDARIAVGDPAAGGYTVSSATNTFTGVEPGVTFSVAALAAGVTLDVDRDDDAVKSGVSAAVDAVNAALSTVASLTARGAVLAGDGAVRPLAQALLSAVTDGSNGRSFAGYGISLTSDGRLVFDAERFASAMQATPSAVASDVGAVLAQRLSDVVDRFAATGTGQLVTARDGSDAQAADLQDRIDAWSVRLDDQQTRLKAKFDAMETALSRLQSQGSYLTSVFASLDASSKSS